VFTQRHNELVDKIRHIFGRIINGIKFCGTHGLILTGRDESDTSYSREIFLDQESELANFYSVFINSIAVLLCQKKHIKN
jgi:hypothetical protein